MDSKRYIPVVSAIIIFLAITAFFFSPLVFGGKQLSQGDIDRFKGASEEITQYRKTHNGQEPLWTNSMFGGMPAYQISTLYPNNWVQYGNKILMGILKSPAPIIFIGMICFYFLLLVMKVDPWLSIAGSFAYGLSAYEIVIITAGHNTQALAVAYMPSVVMGVIITLRGRMWLGAGLTAIALALELYANHLQVTYYLLIALVFIAGGEAIRLYRDKKLNYLFKSLGLLLAAAFIAVLPNLTSLYLTEEYGKYSTRGKSDITIDNKDQTKTNGLPIEYATQWCYGKAETMTLLIPNYYGGASEKIKDYDPDALDAADKNYRKSLGDSYAYFGEQPFTSGPVYVGSIMCFLAVLAMFIVRDKIKWSLFGATILCILLAWGHNFQGLTDFFFYHVPGYNKFRSVYMILVIAQLTIPLLAMLAVKEIVKDPAAIKLKIKFLYIAFAITGGLSLLTYASGPSGAQLVGENESKGISEEIIKEGGDQSAADAYIDQLTTVRMEIAKSDAARSFFFILLAAGLLWFYVRKPFSLPMLAGALSVLVLVDMFAVGKRYMPESDFQEVKNSSAIVKKTRADSLILKDPDKDYRVMNLTVSTWQDATTSFYHKSVGGYHGAKLKRIQELYENVMENEEKSVRESYGAGDSATQAALKKTNALNMLNTKYFIYDPRGGVTTNSNACGSAWFVKEIKWAKDADEELTSISKIDPKKTAVIDKSFQPEIGSITPANDSTAKITLTDYAPNDLKYNSHSSSEGLAVFSEIYYDKGWDAFIDGKPVSHQRADFVLRTMKIPAGDHKIEFKFEPSFYFTGEKLALAGSFLLLIFAGGCIYMGVRKKNEAAAAA
ncbi:MAG: YfhO family protein [Bacteroidetes bacterium]|nr:YfhO family protein [Bacteroidota bacterium]